MVRSSVAIGCLLSLVLSSGCTIIKSWPKPTKAIGMMFNFPPKEGEEQPAPGFFVRAAGSVSWHDEPVAIPKALDTILYEGELVIVIGKRASRVTEAQAARCILGYTCGMDGSPLIVDKDGERDAARSIAGKSTDGVAPIGPKLIHQLNPDGHKIELRVNGEVVESANTKDFVWGPARIVSEISKTVTLERGDVIFCGATRAVPKLKAGDVVEVEIEGIGVLRNRVVAQE